MKAPPGFLLVLALLALSHPTGCATTGEAEPEPAAPLRPAAPVVRRLPDLGIEVAALRLSAADTMLDFRFRVTDPGKAAALTGRKTQVYAVHAATGTRLLVPRAAKIGPLRQTGSEALEGRVYFVFFGNAGRVVKRGNLVTVVFGETRIEGLVVE
jgi:hypothetical protein